MSKELINAIDKGKAIREANEKYRINALPNMDNIRKWASSGLMEEITKAIGKGSFSNQICLLKEQLPFDNTQYEQIIIVAKEHNIIASIILGGISFNWDAVVNKKYE